MTTRQLGAAAAVLALDSALLLAVGFGMWKDSAVDADEAVGKGLVAIGVALALPAVVAIFAWLDRVPHRSRPLAPSRSDWDDV